jgi:hypothetical protein
MVTSQLYSNNSNIDKLATSIMLTILTMRGSLSSLVSCSESIVIVIITFIATRSYYYLGQKYNICTLFKRSRMSVKNNRNKT